MRRFACVNWAIVLDQHDGPGGLSRLGTVKPVVLFEGTARGFFITRGENVPDIMAIPISRFVGGEPLGLAVAGPLARIDAHAEAIFTALRKTGDTLQQINIALRGTA